MYYTATTTSTTSLLVLRGIGVDFWFASNIFDKSTPVLFGQFDCPTSPLLSLLGLFFQLSITTCHYPVQHRLPLVLCSSIFLRSPSLHSRESSISVCLIHFLRLFLSVGDGGGGVARFFLLQSLPALLHLLLRSVRRTLSILLNVHI